MWMVERLVSALTYPVNWFWMSYEKYKEDKCIWKIIALFVISLSGLLVLVSSFLWGVMWLLEYHIEIVAIVGMILWIYACVKAKMDRKTESLVRQSNEQTVLLSQEQVKMQEQAMKGYPIVRNILYQTLKSSAESIGGLAPRLLAEIEIPESHYIISNNICFYQFKLAKADIRMRYQREDLQEFRRMLQLAISGKIQAGDFPTLGTHNFLDAYGNIHDAVCVEVIEDMDSCFVIQAVFYSPEYVEYMRNKQLNAQAKDDASGVPDAVWRDDV